MPIKFNIKKSKPLNAISLFSGMGGDSLGIVNAGLKLIAYSEKESTFRNTHDLNFPNSDLQSLNRVLKEGSAAIYIATPLGETHISSNKTGAYNTDSHLHFFTRKSLNMSLEKAGFTPLDVDDINYPIYSTYLDTTIKEKLKYKLKNFILVKLLKINQRSCVLPSGHISGLAYKK